MKYFQALLISAFIVLTMSSCYFRVNSKWSDNDSTVKVKKYSYGVGLKSESVFNYDYRNFSSVKVSGIAEVIYTQDAKYSVRVVEKNSPKTIVSLKDDQLVIKTENTKSLLSSRMQKAPKVYITSPHLSEVILSGATKFNTKKIAQANLQINASGASKINMEKVDCSNFKLHVSGASKLSADVKATNAIIEASGAMKGDINFVGKEIQVYNSGASKMKLKIDCETLKTNCSGASKLDISGYVDDMDIKKSGVSKVDTSKLNQD